MNYLVKKSLSIKNSIRRSKPKKQIPKKSNEKFKIKVNIEHPHHVNIHNNIHLVNKIEQYQTLNAAQTEFNFNKKNKKYQKKSTNNEVKKIINVNSSSNNETLIANNKNERKSTENASSNNNHQINPKTSAIKKRNNKSTNKNRINTKEIKNNNNNIIINVFNGPINKYTRDNIFNNIKTSCVNNLNNVNITSSKIYNGIYKEKQTKKNILNIDINNINNNKEFKTLISYKNETSNINNFNSCNEECSKNKKNKKRCNTSESFIPLNSGNNENFKNMKNNYNNINKINYNKTIPINHTNFNTFLKKNFIFKTKSIKRKKSNNNVKNNRDNWYMNYNKISGKNKILKNNFRKSLPPTKLINSKLSLVNNAKVYLNKIKKVNNYLNKNYINIHRVNTLTKNNIMKKTNTLYNYLNKLINELKIQQNLFYNNKSKKNKVREMTLDNNKQRRKSENKTLKKNTTIKTKNAPNKIFDKKNEKEILPFSINKNFLNTNSDNQNINNNNDNNINKNVNINNNPNNNIKDNSKNIKDNNNINNINNRKKMAKSASSKTIINNINYRKTLSNRFSHFNNNLSKNKSLNKENNKNKNDLAVKIKQTNNLISDNSYNPTSDYIMASEKSMSQKRSDPQYVEEYLEDILRNLFIEEKNNIKQINLQMSSDFLNNYGINPEIRTCLIDSLINLQKIFKFNERTLFITIQLFDKYVASAIKKNVKIIHEEDLDLILTASLLIASKLEESLIYKLKDYLSILSDKYSTNDLIKMEDEILGVINFSIVSPTMLDFFEIFSTICKFNKKQKSQGMYLLNTILLDINLSQISSSVIAYSVINIITKNENNDNLIKKMNDARINANLNQDEREDTNVLDAFFLLNNKNKIYDLCELIIVFTKGILKTDYINVYEKFKTEEFDFASDIFEDSYLLISQNKI